MSETILKPEWRQRWEIDGRPEHDCQEWGAFLDVPKEHPLREARICWICGVEVPE